MVTLEPIYTFEVIIKGILDECDKDLNSLSKKLKEVCSDRNLIVLDIDPKDNTIGHLKHFLITLKLEGTEQEVKEFCNFIKSERKGYSTKHTNFDSLKES